MSITIDAIQGFYETTDASTVTVASYDMEQNSSGIVTLRAIGSDSSQNTFGTEQRFIVSRALGSCKIVGLGGTTQISASDLALSTASATLAVNGSAIEIQVTGVLAATIDWATRIDIMYAT